MISVSRAQSCTWRLAEHWTLAPDAVLYGALLPSTCTFVLLCVLPPFRSFERGKRREETGVVLFDLQILQDLKGTDRARASSP